MLKLIKNTARNKSASVAVETALLLPLVLAFLLGTIEFGRYFWVFNTLQFAADEAGRYVMVHPDYDDYELEEFVRDRMFGFTESMDNDVEIEVNEETKNGVRFVTISNSYLFKFFIPTIVIDDVTISGKSCVPINN